MDDGTERRARLISDLTILTLLVDKGVIEPEEAIQRIELIRNVLPETFRTDDVAQQLEIVVHFLRSRRSDPNHRWTPKVVEGGLRSREDDQDPPT